MGKKKKNLIWLTDINTMMKVYELAKKRGKKEGDNFQPEFFEVMEKTKSKIKLIGITDKDVDLLTGELREEGKKILNLKEIDRRKKK